MKLQKITLCDFRAFPGPGEYCFDFGNKSHLLIYGENGSGKSSVFKALREFFDLRESAKSFGQMKNFFSDQINNATLICGKVDLTFDQNISKTWSIQPKGEPDNRLRTDQVIREVNRRKALLDYLSLVRVNYTEKDRYGRDTRPNLFGLFIEDLIFDYEVPISGGTPVSIGKLWLDLQDYVKKNQDHRGVNLQYTDHRVKQFNAAVVSAMDTLKNRCDKLLTDYFKHPVTFRFLYTDAQYRKHLPKGKREVDAGYLCFDLHFHGRSFEKYEEVLNEAKLSAVALAVYFSSLIEGVPLGNSGYPRILVLDDVLIGFDMNNRLPVLEILQNEFSDKGWQLVLLTHDKVLYDYAAHQSTGIDWECYELYAGFCLDSNQTKYELPCLRQPGEGAGDFLQRARHQLALHDEKAAAMYARVAFENSLKKYCEKKHLPIPYHMNQNKISADTFFKEIEKNLNVLRVSTNPAPDPVVQANINQALTACNDIKLHRQQVLNPLSHSHVATVTRIEVQNAIDAVDQLINALSAIPK